MLNAVPMWIAGVSRAGVRYVPFVRSVRSAAVAAGRFVVLGCGRGVLWFDEEKKALFFSAGSRTMDNKSARRRPRRLLWPGKAPIEARPDAARRLLLVWPRRPPGQEESDCVDAGTSVRRPSLPLISPRRRSAGRRRIWLQLDSSTAAGGLARRGLDRERRILRFAALVCLMVWSMELVRALWTGSPAWM